MDCPTCHAENSDERSFCFRCGAPLHLTCPSCEFVNQPDAAFCGGCGSTLASIVSEHDDVVEKSESEEVSEVIPVEERIQATAAEKSVPVPASGQIDSNLRMVQPEPYTPEFANDEEREHWRLLSLFIKEEQNFYLEFYDKNYINRKVKKSVIFSWHWPGFLITLLWLWYRKLYLWGFVYLLLSFILAALLPQGVLSSVVFLILWVGLGVFAKRFYVDYALRKLDEINAIDMTSAERDAHIEEVGGVSMAGGSLALAIVIALAVLPLLDN